MDHPAKLCTQRELKTVFGVPFCRQHLARLEKARAFPVRIKLGRFRIAYRVAEVLEYIADPKRWIAANSLGNSIS